MFELKDQQVPEIFGEQILILLFIVCSVKQVAKLFGNNRLRRIGV